jgi:hypothetical protein
MTFIVWHLQTNINMRKLNSLQVILRTTLLNVKILFVFNLYTCVELSNTFHCDMLSIDAGIESLFNK